MRRVLLALAAMVVCASPALAQSVDDNLEADVRCAVVGLSTVGGAADNEQMQQAGTMLAIYYIGRVHGRAPLYDIEGAIIQQANAMTLTEVDRERGRCGAQLASVGNALSQMGARMQQGDAGGAGGK